MTEENGQGHLLDNDQSQQGCKSALYNGTKRSEMLDTAQKRLLESPCVKTL